MSRIGKMPIILPKGVKVEWKSPVVTVTGGKTTLTREMHPKIQLTVAGDAATVAPDDMSNQSRSLWGLSRTLVNNMVIGVSAGFTKVLEVSGVGWRAEQADAKTLKLSLGFSNPVIFPLPDGISAQVDAKTNKITLSGANKEVLGEVAAKIRALRKPEPYKGKGIKYEGEFIARKVGKAGGK